MYARGSSLWGSRQHRQDQDLARCLAARPHTTIYVSSYFYICVLIFLYMCPHVRRVLRGKLLRAVLLPRRRRHQLRDALPPALRLRTP